MSGFHSKREAAAGKLHEPQAMQGLAAYLRCEAGGVFVGSPNHETLMQWAREVDAARAQPAQEPVARVTGVYGGRFTYDPINRAMVLPIGMALYAGPPQREWVGLNEKERNDIEDDFYANISIHVFDAIEAKLKEKNT